MRTFHHLTQSLAIVAGSILACVFYGVAHDQVTARICIEYFTIGHAGVLRFPIDDPTIIGLIWGVLATWWVGVLLGVPLACAARAGKRRPREFRSLIRPIAILLLCNGLFATTSGLTGFIAASNGWIHLTGPLAESVPPDRQIGFLTDLWAHNASYLSALCGGMILCVRVWKSRSQTESSSA